MSTRIAVAGAGLIGRRHIEEIVACPDTELAAVLDPAPAARELAEGLGVRVHGSWAELFAAGRPDGVVVATPNALHVEGGLACIAQGVPVLVEKPLAATSEGALALVEAAESAGVPLLTGHHRQHSPIMRAARQAIASGLLGRVVSVMGSATFYKPDGYFDVGGGWRRQPGGGPLLINLIHEVNALLSLVGDVASVQALSSSAVRGFPVEDTAAMVFRFADGPVGTFVVSDTAAAPWSWEQTSQENAAYAAYPDQDCYFVTGTAGSLAVPSLRLRTVAGAASWLEPMEERVLTADRTDPLAHQIRHFAAVVRGEEEPVVSGRDGLATLRVVEAVLEAAATGHVVAIPAGRSSPVVP